MPKIDVTKFMEQCGMRKARFGGYEPEDVRAALQAVCGEYEQRLSRAESQARKTAQENAALQQHCQALSAQNQRLSGQNAALAGSSETYSRQKEDLNARVAALQERNHSLSDQCAVLRLKNSGLQKEKDQFRERTEQAEAELRIKGRALDEARALVEQGRAKAMEDAKAEADKMVEEAKVKAAVIEQEARANAAAIEVAAREQAKEQAQKLVDAAAAEANEIQNAHQLRLNNLRGEVRELEAQRAAFLDYLGQMGRKLTAIQSEAAQDNPADRAAAQDNADRALESDLPDLQAVPTPEAKLDLSPETLASFVDAVRAQAACAQQGEELPPDAAVQVPAEPEQQPAAPEPPEPEQQPAQPTGDPNHQTGPALTEVPGAIFSSPIVRPVESARPDATPPDAAPRAPVMPVFEEDEESEEPEPQEPEPEPRPEPEPAAAPEPAARQDSPRRRKAVRALRALDQMFSRIDG